MDSIISKGSNNGCSERSNLSLPLIGRYQVGANCMQRTGKIESEANALL
ncbi:hypothetical protein H6G91_39700 [Nostoc muscorum FACHB-395]|nr:MULTISPECIES: hypothetical protein [unclassified Nostoc]MBD2513211.1 hypothetical protein [Desmonostoc muscorum FACHB-395]